MTTVAEVRLWGRTIGAVSQGEGEAVVSFEYEAGFSQSGIEVSPLTMPLSRRVYRFPELAPQAFHGLPGLLADSLPDRFGNALIDSWLARQGRNPGAFSALERLCYTGTRGMGALEFVPSLGPEAGPSQRLEVDALVDLASQVLQARAGMAGVLAGPQADQTLGQILRVGTSAGGARAKAVVAWNPATGEVRSGQGALPSGFEPWLLKFDGVAANGDRELADPRGFGAIEYAYHLMARRAGITMTDCRLFEENGRRHFMTRRFDRTTTGAKLHMQSLGALAHWDYNQPGAHGYEQAFAVLRRLGLGLDAAEELFRRMAFNIVARNQDDHVKNLAFLMDKAGLWSLAPAFDLTYAWNPGGPWTGSHQMSLGGKRDGFVFDDFRAAAALVGLKRGRDRAIVNEVGAAVQEWTTVAAEAGVDPGDAARIGAAFRKIAS